MKNFVKALLGLMTILIIGFVILLSQVNSERNKQAIQMAVQDATGYELTIGGDLALDLLPNFGLSLSDIRLRNPAYPQELASAAAAVLKVDIAALIGGQILVQEISAENFHANYYIQADGSSIWEVGDSNGSSNATQQAASSNQPSTAIDNFSIDRLRIANASIDIQDQSQGTRYRLNKLNLDSTDTNLAGRPFTVDLQFDYANNGMSAPVPMTLFAEVNSDLTAGNINLDEVRVSITPMLLQGNIAISNLNDAPEITANLSAAPFDVLALLESMALREANPELDLALDSGRQLSFQLSLSGDTRQLAIPEFSMDFAGTEISADANVRFATELAPTSVSYNLTAGDIDLSPLFPATPDNPATEELTQDSSVNSAAQYQPETEIPAELIQSLSLLGSIAIDSVTVNEMRIDGINVFTNIEDGVLDIEMPPANLLEGSVQATARVDTRANVPEVVVASTVQDINLVDLAPSLSRFNTVTGYLQAESNYTAQGLTTSALMESVSGNTAFNIFENSVDIGVIKQVFTAIAALSPTGEAIQQWPDVISFNSMSGYWLLTDGLNSDQELQLRMDNFDISGTGGFALDAGTFDYDLQFAVLGEPFDQTIPINELYHDVPWPVDCSGAFSDQINRYCRPDFTRVREIFTQIGTNAVRGRLQDAITDQLPSELQDSARGLLRSILN